MFKINAEYVDYSISTISHPELAMALSIVASILQHQKDCPQQNPLMRIEITHNNKAVLSHDLFSV